MNPNSTAIFAQRVTPRAGRNAVVVGVVSCLAVTGFAAAVHRAGAASSIQSDSDIVSVDHSHKGDRTTGPKEYLSCFVACRDNTLAAADRT
jgi:hypothetical protein